MFAMCCGPGGAEAEVVVVDAAKSGSQPRDAGAGDRSPLESPRGPAAAQPSAFKPSEGGQEPVVFAATVQKGSRPLGMDVNYHDKATFLVTRVNAGPCQDYNLTDPDLLIAPGDRIVSVNGVSGDTNQMLQACKAAELKLTVRKCDEKRVMLMKRFPEQKLGIAVEQCDTVTLVIAGVEEAGDSVVAEYNQTNRASGGLVLEKDFRIIGVNSVYGDAGKLEAELQSADSWTLAIRQVFVQ